MKGGGSAVNISDEQREQILATTQPEWNKEVKTACGDAKMKEILGLFDKYKY